MLCEKCNKRKATVHLTDLLSGDKLEKHLCDKCAGEEGVQSQTHVPFEKLLTSFVMNQTAAQETAELTCPKCGISYAEFRNTGLLGCPNDYTAFEGALAPLLERAHGGATHHVGKVANGAGGGDRKQGSLLRMRHELADAVKAEDYERAARIRDKIRTLETI